MINVIVADDHPIVSNGMRDALDRHPFIKTVGVASSSSELFFLLSSEPCEVLLTDYSMPGGEHGDGLPMLQSIRRRFPHIQIALLSAIDNPAILHNLICLGICVVLSKKDSLDYLAPAVIAAHHHHTYFSPTINSLLQENEYNSNKKNKIRLSKRELEVIRLCALGMPLVEIAKQANRSAKTISSQKSVAMRKLGLNGDYELYQYAIATGLITPTD